MDVCSDRAAIGQARFNAHVGSAGPSPQKYAKIALWKSIRCFLHGVLLSTVLGWALWPLSNAVADPNVAVSVTAPSASAMASIDGLILNWMPDNVSEKLNLSFYLPSDVDEADLEALTLPLLAEEIPIVSSAIQPGAKAGAVNVAWIVREQLAIAQQSISLIWQKARHRIQPGVHYVAQFSASAVEKTSNTANAAAQFAKQTTQRFTQQANAAFVSATNSLSTRLTQRTTLAQEASDLHQFIAHIGQSADQAYDDIVLYLQYQWTFYTAQLRQISLQSPLPLWIWGAGGAAGFILIGGSLFGYRRRAKRQQKEASSDAEIPQREKNIEAQTAAETAVETETPRIAENALEPTLAIAKEPDNAEQSDQESVLQAPAAVHDVDKLAEDLASWLEKHPAISASIEAAASPAKRARSKKKAPSEKNTAQTVSAPQDEDAELLPESLVTKQKESPDTVTSSSTPVKKLPTKTPASARSIRRKQTVAKEKQEIEEAIQEEFVAAESASPAVQEASEKSFHYDAEQELPEVQQDHVLAQDTVKIQEANEAVPKASETPMTDEVGQEVEVDYAPFSEEKVQMEEKENQTMISKHNVDDNHQSEPSLSHASLQVPQDAVDQSARLTVVQAQQSPGPLKVIRAFGSAAAPAIEAELGIIRTPAIQTAHKVRAQIDKLTTASIAASVTLDASNPLASEENSADREVGQEHGIPSEPESDTLSHFKLELAKAYSALGEVESAKALLEEASQSTNDEVAQAASEQLAELPGAPKPKRRRAVNR